MAREAKDCNVLIRIGVNGGSLDPALYEKHGGLEARGDGRVRSTGAGLLRGGRLRSRREISVKASNVLMMVEAYRQLSEATDASRHLGVTEAGRLGGLVKATAGIATLLLEGSAIRSAIRSLPTRSRRPRRAGCCSKRSGYASARTRI
ncbi:MAG: flavodoxin-dependent (E)-4-hydroxy-3-methylbut-2-enyl-diphosphate synthase [Ilumatobacteraceae bacterium]